MRRSSAQRFAGWAAGVLILAAGTGLAAGDAASAEAAAGTKAAPAAPAAPAASPTPAAPASSPAPEAPETPEAKIEAALAKTVAFDRDRLQARDALARISRAAGLTITIDPELRAQTEAAEVTLPTGELPARKALGLFLRQLGLRYAVEGETLYVSTLARLTARLRAREAAAADVPEEEPLTSDEASLRRYRDEAFESGRTLPSMGFSTDTYYLSPAAPLGIVAFGPTPYDPADAYAYDPGQWPVTPYVDPATGLWNYPAPPLWGRPLGYSNDRRAAYFTDRPYFVHPAFRGIVPQTYSDAVTSYWPVPVAAPAGAMGLALPAAPAGAPAPASPAETAAASVAVARVILTERVREALSKNPKLTAAEILELLKQP